MTLRSIFRGFALKVEKKETKATNQQHYEKLAEEVGRVDLQPVEFFDEVIDLIEAGVEHREEFADAALRLVRGAATINAMVDRIERKRRQKSASAESTASPSPVPDDQTAPPSDGPADPPPAPLRSAPESP